PGAGPPPPAFRGRGAAIRASGDYGAGAAGTRRVPGARREYRWLMSSTVAPPPQRASVAERRELGRAARKRVPRSSHANFTPAPDRPDPLELLERQAATRVSELVPIRYGRMLVSPFT